MALIKQFQHAEQASDQWALAIEMKKRKSHGEKGRAIFSNRSRAATTLESVFCADCTAWMRTANVAKAIVSTSRYQTLSSVVSSAMLMFR